MSDEKMTCVNCGGEPYYEFGGQIVACDECEGIGWVYCDDEPAFYSDAEIEYDQPKMTWIRPE